MRPNRAESGQVLWLVVIVLGSLAQLAIITIGQAAASGLSVRRIEAYWQREILVEHIAEQLQQLPLQRVSAPDQQALWHPLGELIRRACADDSRQSWTQTPCLDNAAQVNDNAPAIRVHQSRWAWQLERDGEWVASWPSVLTQRYRLRVRAASANGQMSHWQFDYEQRSLP